jgi:hypothetical protein
LKIKKRLRPTSGHPILLLQPLNGGQRDTRARGGFFRRPPKQSARSAKLRTGYHVFFTCFSIILIYIPFQKIHYRAIHAPTTKK